MNFEKISKAVQSELTSETIMVCFNADIYNVAPWMCSPSVEEAWIWSESTKELSDYIYQIIIPFYLISVVRASGENIEIENKQYEFLDALEIYKKRNYCQNEEIKGCIERFQDVYKRNFDKEINYTTFKKMLIDLKRILKMLEVYFEASVYNNPDEARAKGNFNM